MINPTLPGGEQAPLLPSGAIHEGAELVNTNEIHLESNRKSSGGQNDEEAGRTKGGK
jgi:hypothetical protein